MNSSSVLSGCLEWDHVFDHRQSQLKQGFGGVQTAAVSLVGGLGCVMFALASKRAVVTVRLAKLEERQHEGS